MRARERFFAITVTLVLVFGVGLLGLMVYGDDNYDVPTLLEAAPLGTEHPAWDATDLNIALNNATCGDTITLMDNIAIPDISISGRSITLITNGFTLDVYHAVIIMDGALLLDDSGNGEFNVSSYSLLPVHVADNGKLEVTNVTATTGNAIAVDGRSTVKVSSDVTTKDANSSAIQAQDGSIVYVGGNVVAAGSGVHVQTGAIVTVEGDIIAHSFGAKAESGGKVHITNGSVTSMGFGNNYSDTTVSASGASSTISIGGNVTSFGRGSLGVQAGDGAEVIVGGDVFATNAYSIGIWADGADSFILVGGSIASYSRAVGVSRGGVAIVEGNASGMTGPSMQVNRPIVASADDINSEIIIRGNIISSGFNSTGASVARGAKITVYGNVTAHSFGVSVFGDGLANIGGNVLITNTHSSQRTEGASAHGVNAVINITGDISTDVYGRGTGALAWGGGIININGNVTSNYVGAFVRYSGYIRISGTLTAPTNIQFMELSGAPQPSAGYVIPTTLPGYFTYTNTPANPTSTVWVRGNPTVTNLIAATPSLPYTGGNSLINLTGSDFGAADIRIAAFQNNTGSALYAQSAASIATQATATLNFPANTTNSSRNYTIKVSFDGGVTWLTTPTTKVTVAPDITAPPPSNDATLSSIFTTPGILAPAFNPSVLEYTVSVGSHVTTVNATALANCPHAAVTITGYNLTEGQNTVTVLVTAQDGTTRNHTFTINVTRATAVVRLHWHIPGMVPYTEIGLSNINTAIPAYLIPTVPVRYGTPGNPGWAFLGWYEELLPNMHYTNNQNSVTHTQRLAAIDLLANLVITEVMLDDDNVYELHASWLQYGDLNGDGTISPLDRSLMQNRLLGGLTDDDMVMQTANLDKSEANITPTDRSLLQNHILGAPGVILPSR